MEKSSRFMLVWWNWQTPGTWQRWENFIRGLPVFYFINRGEYYVKQSKMEELF